MRFEDWGLIDYKAAQEKQLQLVEKVKKSEIDETVIFCSHPPVVTLGRASKPSDILSWTGGVVNVQRGGRATYHGPGQLIIYPILNLKNATKFKDQDVGAYLRFLERVIINTLQKVGIESYQKEEEIFDEDGKKLLMTGVWVKDYKVASIGIALKNWVSFHGMAMNVHKDPLAFQGISPCGFKASPMKSLEEIFHKTPDRSELVAIFRQQF